MIDPGLMTDATGDGMAGATDVSLFTQKSLENTYYNGSKPCLQCGLEIEPYRALHTQYCPGCKSRRDAKLVKNRMVSE
jgi:DNA-directed RNA polymerase subunit RPC12/RpoP